MEEAMTARGSIGACVLALLIPAAALSQTPAPSFEELIAKGAIQPDDTVYVTDAWGHRVKGRLGELRPGTLVLTDGSRTIQMAEADVARIQRGD
jgi:hypothetical protein